METMTNGAIGEIQPRLIIQEDTKACLSAALLTQLPPQSGVDEQAVSEILSHGGIYQEGVGSGLFPASELDASVRKLGLKANPVYDARGPVAQEDQQVIERLAKIDAALRSGQNVLLAYPRQREGSIPFLHYSMVTGFTETPTGDGVVIVDPSDVDGGVRHPSWQELDGYVRPIEGLPVMAWGIEPAEERVSSTVSKVSERGLPGFSLLAKPLYRAEDTGQPIPTGTEHPVSVAMPTTEITTQFHDYGDIVLSREGKQPIGYPRFVIPPAIKALSRNIVGKASALPFPDYESVKAAAHLENTYGSGATISEAQGLYWLPDTKLNRDGWQHAGTGLSPRQAVAVQEGRPHNDLERRAEAEQKIKATIEHYTGALPEDIYLLPTGMSAIYLLNQALIEIAGEAPGVQFGFPYTDSYEQRKFGPSRNIKRNILDFRAADYEGLEALVASGQPLRAIITEYPSNPLLQTADIHRLDMITAGEVPLVIDDTVGSIYNLDNARLPASVAARVTSLTKFFSSVGDVMGGSIVLRPQSPHYQRLKAGLDELYTDSIWHEDAEVLAENSKLFHDFMPVINSNGAELAQWLSETWAGEGKPLQTVYYPSLINKPEYDALRKPRGGYGGLLSLRFKNAEQGFRFFDELKVTKGPSLGTYYTLGCLYTLLAHKPVESVEQFGVTADLVRLSIGIEDLDELKERTERAMQASKVN
jgi:cystathionine gamma-synthase